MPGSDELGNAARTAIARTGGDDNAHPAASPYS
jgi:hypothetical protein